MRVLAPSLLLMSRNLPAPGLQLAASTASPAPLQHHVYSDDKDFFVFVAMSVACVALAGMMSGLTLGLLSINKMELEVLKRSGTQSEKSCAKKIKPLLGRPHQLLISLVLANAIATEALPIFLDRLINPVAAVAVSIVVVLIFGEVVPQAACTKYGLAIGARCAWFVSVLMFITSPIAWPCSLLLDWALGTHKSAIMKRRQLKVLVEVHGSQEGLGGTLTPDEIFVIQGALDLSRKSAAHACTPLNKVFMLSSEAVLDGATLQSILASGHSRIPVYQGTNRQAILGAFLVKELAWLDKSSHTPVASLTMRSIPTLPAGMPCYDLLRLFQTGRSHMAVLVQPPQQPLPESFRRDGDSFTGEDGQVHLRVQAPYEDQDEDSSVHVGHMGRMSSSSKQDPWQKAVEAAEADDMAAGVPVGIITLEDILEELLQREIVDETDEYIDNERRTRVDAASILQGLPPHLRTIVQGKMFKPRVGRLASIRTSLNGGIIGASSTGNTALLRSSITDVPPHNTPTTASADDLRSELSVTQADVRAAIDALTPLLSPHQ